MLKASIESSVKTFEFKENDALKRFSKIRNHCAHQILHHSEFFFLFILPSLRKCQLTKKGLTNQETKLNVIN